jgi:hypothetical protein
MINYGGPPKIIGEFSPVQPEMMFYLYLPIKMVGDRRHRLPERLMPYAEMIDACIVDFQRDHELGDFYIYVTSKTMFVSPGQPGNREGWHADGFGSHGDINYLWSDKNPTQFAVQDFGEISANDKLSMIQMEARVKTENIVTYPVNSLLRLDESVIHRVSDEVQSGVRRFVKISFSQHRFANEGNSHNYLFNYDWPMAARQLSRNLDAKP